MVGLMASADTGHTGVLKFENFVGFFTRNLLSLEREKHIRLLQTSINAQKAVTTEVVAAVTTQEQSDFIEHLTTVFNLYDKDNTGYIHFTDFESVLVKFSLQSSKYLVDVMLTELQVKEDGMVNCKEAILQCNELLQVSIMCI
ncbi:hypothetical protein B484DRAFT_12318 [Ochromonadaceae sp. CCMP2298]|nr:hypothetical protein B484DRAFT_12318 [Ochromonadaceae sp. CCMP2298]